MGKRNAIGDHKDFMGDRKRIGKPLKIDDLPHRELVILWLNSRGYEVVPGRSNKYITLERPGEEKKYFVGSHGGLWFGEKVSSKIGSPIKFDWDRLRIFLKEQGYGI